MRKLGMEKVSSPSEKLLTHLLLGPTITAQSEYGLASGPIRLEPAQIWLATLHSPKQDCPIFPIFVKNKIDIYILFRE